MGKMLLFCLSLCGIFYTFYIYNIYIMSFLFLKYCFMICELIWLGFY